MPSNKKISELTEFTAAQLADDDLIVMVDVSDSTTKKVAASTFRATVAGVESLTAVAPLSVDAPDGDVTIQITDPLPIANGGTAATTASVARTNLGLGTIATQDASNVSITGGAISGITDLAVADGGTGASTAAAARTNLGAAASGANSDITSLTGLTTALSVPQGGTGATTLTSNNVILGNGSSAVQFVAPGTSGNVLTSNGTTWSSSAPASSVTSFSAGSTGFTPSTATTGAVTLAGTLDADNGGTGISSYAVGDVLYANTTSTLAKLADVATGNALISGGVGTAPSYGKIGLTTHVSGTLAATNGGTDNASYAVGDILYASTTTALSKLADVATGNALISGGVGTAPSYGKIGLTTHISGTLAIGNGGTGATTAATAATALGVGTGDSPTFAGLNIDTNLGVDGQWNTSGLTVYANGVTPQHDGPLHVMSGSAGTVTASAGGDELVIEGSAQTGISLLTPDNNNSVIYFGTPTATNTGAQLLYSYNAGSPIINFGTLTGASSLINFYTGAATQVGQWNTIGLTCFASGVTPQHDGVLHVMSGSAGTVSARSDADEFTVEGAADSGISILTPDGFGGTLRFSSPTSLLLGKVGCSYNSGNPSFALGTQYGGGTVTILTGAGTTALTLNASQQALFNAGSAAAPSVALNDGAAGAATGMYFTNAGGITRTRFSVNGKNVLSLLYNNSTTNQQIEFNKIGRAHV